MTKITFGKIGNLLEEESESVDYWLRLAPRLWLTEADLRSQLHCLENLLSSSEKIRQPKVIKAKLEAIKQLLLIKNETHANVK